MIRKIMIIAVLIPSMVFCQTKVDVLKLKNGDVIKGDIIENKINDYIRIELMGGSILTYEYNKIEAIEKEESKTQSVAKPQNITKSSSTNCYQDGFDAGQIDYRESGTLAGMAGGVILGFIGWAIAAGSVAGQVIQVPNDKTSSLEDDPNCRNDYVNGYKDGAMKKKKTNVNTGGALGTLVAVLILASGS